MMLPVAFKALLRQIGPSQSIEALPFLGNVRSLAAVPQKLQLIRDLRESSGAPISDVKAALDDADYEIGAAFQILRRKGLAAANKKASRRASEGLIGLARTATDAVLLEINSETDFVARNEKFTNMVSTAAQVALDSKLKIHENTVGVSAGHEIEIEELAQSQDSAGQSLDSLVKDLAGTLRENICLRRAYRLQVKNGVLSTYLHISPAPGLGRIGSMVALEAGDAPMSASCSQALEVALALSFDWDQEREVACLQQEVGNKLAMHAAAASPRSKDASSILHGRTYHETDASDVCRFLDQSSVPAEAIEAEKGILREQAAKSGKPDNIIEKMITGRLKKFYEEVCLLEQEFVMDDSVRIKDLLKRTSNELGVPIRPSGFVRVQCGQGLEDKSSKDFASEVAETLERTA